MSSKIKTLCFLWAFSLTFLAMAQKKEFKKVDAAELKKRLSPLQYEVTQKDGTERPFQNEYWDNKRPGIYVDITTGEPLFSSEDKFDSGTGWPSFSKPIEKKSVRTKTDGKLMMKRTEVRSATGDAHLGHVFEDGPKEQGGLRYCVNSASMRFVAYEDLVKEGYAEYLSLFSSNEKAVANTERLPQSEKKSQGLSKTETATLAGGCFWGMEDLLRKIPGVVDTWVGYTGGNTERPRYEDVKTGNTGHAEAVQVVFDPSKTNYEKILIEFFKMHDPTTANRQGNDVGTQYRSAIFYHDEAQRKAAVQMKVRVDKSGAWKKPVVTEILPFAAFFKAEDYHQDYLEKNPGGYTCHFTRKIEF